MTNEELNKTLIKADMEYDKLKDTVAEQSFEIERLNNIIENLTTMTVNGDRTQIKNTAQYKLDRAIEYVENETWFNRKDLLKILKGSE